MLLVRPKSPTIKHPPLGLLHLAAGLRARGHDAAILDGMASPLTPESASRFAQTWGAEAVGFGGMSCEYPETRRFASELRNRLPGLISIFGGPHATGNPDQCLSDGADFVLAGEGEVTLPRLLDEIRSGHALPRLWQGTPPDVDAEPWPAYDLVNMESYIQSTSPWFFPRGRRAMPLITSRGCPYACSYCHGFHGKTFRGISPRRVAEHIDFLVARYRIDEVMVIDDIFNLDLERSKQICREVIRRHPGVSMQFPYLIRGDLCDRELIRLMRLAGTHYLGIAFETASTVRMKAVGKALKLEDCRCTAQWAREEGIEVCGFFMIGFPDESIEEMRSTADMALSAPVDWLFLSVVAAYGGTRLRRDLGPVELDVRFPFVASVPLPQLRRLRRSIYIHFYARPDRFLRLLRALPNARNGPKIVRAVLQRLSGNRRDMALN